MMTLLAGYFCKDGREIDDIVKSKVDNYSILPADPSDAYESSVIGTKFGHLLFKYRRGNAFAGQIYRGPGGNALALLGFVLPADKNAIANRAMKKAAIESCAADIEGMEGEFVAVLAGESSGDIHIINDRFASKPFFIVTIGNATYFSSDPGFLIHFIGGRHEVDVLGLLQMFALEHTVQTRTIFRDIRRLGPATHVIITKDAVKDRPYWKFQAQPQSDLDPKQYSEETFAALQESAIARTGLPGKSIITLTGGADTRLIAAALAKVKDIDSLTWVVAPTSRKLLELEAASKVARAFGYRHHTERIRWEDLPAMAKELVRLTGGMLSIDGPIGVLQAIAFMRRTGTRFLFGGGPGDAISGGYTFGFPDYLRSLILDENSVEKCIRAFCLQKSRPGFSMDIMAHLFRKDVLSEYYPLVEQSLVDSFSEITGPTFSHQVTAWGMSIVQPATWFANPMRNHPDCDDVFPHLGYKFAQSMTKLPAEWLYKRNFYNYMIYHCVPELRGVDYVNTTARHPTTNALSDYHGCRTWSELMTQGKQQAKEIVKRFTGEHIINFARNAKLNRQQNGSLPFWYEIFVRDQEWVYEVREVLQSREWLGDILDVDGCCRFLDGLTEEQAWRADPYSKANAFARLATLCFSVEEFAL
jgi:hypothetical protein